LGEEGNLEERYFEEVIGLRQKEIEVCQEEEGDHFGRGLGRLGYVVERRDHRLATFE
jgi:hypothetical protein